MSQQPNKAKERPSLTTLILAGLVLGIAWGLFFGKHGAWVKWIGDAYVGLLQMTVLPYVAITLVSNVSRLSAAQGKRLAGVAFVVQMTLWIIGLITLVVFSFSFPDRKTGSFFSTSLIEAPDPPNWLELFIPSNPFRSLTDNLVPAVVLFSIGLGVALMRVSNKERLLEALDALTEGLSQLNRMVVSLSPIGIFAIIGHTFGTTSLDQFGLLQGYLLVHGAAAMLISFFLLPAFLAGCTPFSFREILGACRDMLITAFVIGNTFAVLPMIIDTIHSLMEEHKSEEQDPLQSPEYSVQLAYPFPDVGGIVALVFIPFAAWFYGTNIEPASVPPLVGVGFVSTFAKPVVSVPLLLNLAHIPEDIFSLFITVGVIASRFTDLMKVMHLFTFSILTTCILSGAIRIGFARLLMVFVGTTSVVLLSVFSIRTFLDYSFHDAYSKENLMVSRKLLGTPVATTIVKGSAANPALLTEDLDRISRIRQQGMIRIGINPDALPFSYYDDSGQLVGFDIDMAHQLGQDLGVRIEFVTYSGDVIKLLHTDHFDIAMSGLEGTTRRALELPHVDPYLEVTVAFVVPDYRRPDFRTLDQMVEIPNLRIGAIAGSKASEIRFDSIGAWGPRERYDDIEIIELANMQAFFESDQPVADVLLTSAEAGSAWTLRYPQFSVVKPVDLNVRLPLYYFVADESQFEEFVENWLALKRRDGTIERLYDYWILGKDIVGNRPRWCILRDVLHWID